MSGRLLPSYNHFLWTWWGLCFPGLTVYFEVQGRTRQPGVLWEFSKSLERWSFLSCLLSYWDFLAARVPSFQTPFCSALELLPSPSHTKVESPFWSLGSWLVPRLGLCLVSALNRSLTPVHLLRLLYYLLGTQGLHFFHCLSRRSPLTSSPDTKHQIF